MGRVDHPALLVGMQDHNGFVSVECIDKPPDLEELGHCVLSAGSVSAFASTPGIGVAFGK